MSALWLRLLRSLDLRAPEDGMCNTRQTMRVTAQRYAKIEISYEHYRCVLPWRHKREGHDLVEIGTREWHEEMQKLKLPCPPECYWDHEASA